ncbi:MAG TPA: protein-disulfide reductase DsbD domain-containing protein [Bacteroidia bacterium]|nr:protein-disulfide reductase DsbD domain-containing protein [Bacteroidia bacterium]
MRKLLPLRVIVPLVLIFYCCSPLTAQTPNPVKWECSVEQLSKTEAMLTMKAIIEEGWHLYSQDLPDGGPIKTAFVFEPSSNYTLNGVVTEGDPIDYYDPNFEMDLKYFSHEAEFKQKISFTPGATVSIKATVEFMVCDDHRCLPPETVPLSFELVPEKSK